MNIRIFKVLILSVALGFSAGCASTSQDEKPTSESVQDQTDEAALEVETNQLDEVVPEVDAADEASPVEGTWQGALEVSGTSLTIVFHVAPTPDEPGGLEATMDSPNQGATGIPVSEVLFDDGQVQLKVAAADGVYDGTLSEDGDTIDGTWTQGGQTFPLSLERASAE